MVTAESLKDPKGLAKKLVKAASDANDKAKAKSEAEKVAKDTSVDTGKGKTEANQKPAAVTKEMEKAPPKMDPKEAAKLANLNKKDFLKNKPTNPNPTSLVGVDISKVPVR